jgi:hypothetical protein
VGELFNVCSNINLGLSSDFVKIYNLKWKFILASPNLEEQHVKEIFYEDHEAFFGIDFGMLSLNTSLGESFWDQEDVLDIIDWEFLYRNPNISEEFYEKNAECMEWYSHSLYKNPRLSRAFFERHLDKVDWRSLCVSSILPISFFEDHEEMIEWDDICLNENISSSFFEKHREKIHMTDLITYGCLSADFWLNNMENIDDEDWEHLYDNDRITEGFWLKQLQGENKDKIDWNVLSYKNFSIDFWRHPLVHDNIVWKSISQNSYIDVDFLEENKENINWERFSSNSFNMVSRRYTSFDKQWKPYMKLKERIDTEY